MNPHNIPLSLYIHLPWCVKKCPYCDFNSHTLRGELPEAAYVAAIIRDLQAEAARMQALVPKRPLQTIFFGGGTPSLFSAKAIAQILTASRDHFAWDDHIEITLEANPGATDESRFAGYRAAGVNRLSIGIQSFAADKLAALGRIHDSQQAIHAAAIAQAAGFENFNLDLMFGLPQQTPRQALADLAQAVALQPTHLSWYQLTLEPHTLFHARPPALPDDDSRWHMQAEGQQYLAQNGFAQYEISAYAQPQRLSRHNVNYWQFGDYLGIGAGAHGKISCTDGRILRTLKTSHPKDYLNPQIECMQKQHAVAPAQLPFEYMLNRLRLLQPLDLQDFEIKTGLPVSCLYPVLEQAQAQGLIDYNDNNMTLTALGRNFTDNLVQMFLP